MDAPPLIAIGKVPCEKAPRRNGAHKPNVQDMRLTDATSRQAHRAVLPREIAVFEEGDQESDKGTNAFERLVECLILKSQQFATLRAIDPVFISGAPLPISLHMHGPTVRACGE
jgi:hypothetical protein